MASRLGESLIKELEDIFWSVSQLPNKVPQTHTLYLYLPLSLCLSLSLSLSIYLLSLSLPLSLPLSVLTVQYSEHYQASAENHNTVTMTR
jgi:hypothetical protein